MCTQTVIKYIAIFSQILTNISLNLCNNSDQPAVSVFNISPGTGQTLMHEKNMFDPFID